MTAETHTHLAAEQPILWLGMSGFAPQQRAVLEASLTRSSGFPCWRTCTFGDADAWWVNGAKVNLAPDGNLKVAPGLPTERGLKLNLSEVDRPIAFALPLAGDDFEPRYTFDPVSEPSIHAVLLQFETWLWLTRAEFVLGAQVVHRGAELRRGVYQVSHSGRLLAVLDFEQGKAALLPRVHPVDLWEAQWDRRPIGAHDLPESFVQVTPAQLAWAYVRRTDRDMLPPRYRSETVYYRRAPGVPMRWLRDPQLMLLRELASEPATLDGLRQRTGMPLDQIEHDLTCLYYAGAVTTTQAKAAAPLVARHDSQPHTSGPGWDSLLRNDAHVHYEQDLTAPAQLEHRRKAPPASDSV
ncbi:MAG: hypothetical protein JWQ07_1702 [Ramlibacter sp.]|nr:hypothetical protein [Ramlibacter sp.]